MARPKFVQIPAHSLERFRPLLGSRYGRVEEAAVDAAERYRGRAIWHVSSTLRGGGVAEMLRSLLPYVRGAGVDTRWVVLRESDRFFALTKRLHNNLHGDPGDGAGLSRADRHLYERSLASSARHFASLLQAGDVVFLHDPQTAGLTREAKAAGATVIWRCHIGSDHPNDLAIGAQDFLRPYVQEADAWVFSRDPYAWQGLDRGREWILAPSLDPFSPKNQEMRPSTVEAVLGAVGLGGVTPARAPEFTRADGTPGRVERRAQVFQEEPIPAEATLVAQVSRWDRLKDHRGLLLSFERRLEDDSLHLLLAGPASAAVADDPEGDGVWAEVRAAWRRLPDRVRCRVHLANLPMYDLDENGAVVNAIQRRADVVVQKSIAEGFGLTVAEAMWKGRPVIGSGVGGIQDQIVAGVSGLLVDPHDLPALARAIESLASDPDRARSLGAAAHERVVDQFLAASRLAEYAERLAGLEAEPPPR